MVAYVLAVVHTLTTFLYIVLGQLLQSVELLFPAVHYHYSYFFSYCKFFQTFFRMSFSSLSKPFSLYSLSVNSLNSSNLCIHIFFLILILLSDLYLVSQYISSSDFVLYHISSFFGLIIEYIYNARSSLSISSCGSSIHIILYYIYYY